MKFILIIFTLASIYGAFGINIPLKGQNGLKDFLVAQFTYTIISPVSNAITNAIGNVTLWTGGKPSTRLELLNEFKTFQLNLEQSMHEITESFLNGTLLTEYQSLLLKLNISLQIHLNHINILITILIPTMEDSTATHAITSSLDVVQATKLAMEDIDILISS
jgi:hypothetical protein